MIDFTNLTLILVALITGVISPILVHAFRFFLISKKPKPACDVSKNLKNEDLIATKLTKIRETLKSDRVWICEFHNGGHTFTGKSIQKFSQTYEVVQRGISKEGMNTQNLPTSLFSTFFNAVASSSEVHVSDVEFEDNPLVNSIKSFLDNRGVKSFAAAIIKNIEGHMIGILGIDFVTKKERFNKEEIYSLKDDAKILAGYLENQ